MILQASGSRLRANPDSPDSPQIVCLVVQWQELYELTKLAFGT